MAAQLMATKGLSLRGLLKWMARATSSLPVPDSPVSRTLARLSQTSVMLSMTLRKVGLPPTSMLELIAALQLAAQALVVGQHVRQAQGVLDGLFQFVDLEGLAHIVEGAFLDQLDGILDRTIGSHHHHRQLGMKAFDLGHQLAARHAGHTQVGQQKMHGLGFQEAQGLGSPLAAISTR